MKGLDCQRGKAREKERGRREAREVGLTISATRVAVSKRVGKKVVLMNELTNIIESFDLDRCRQIRTLSGSPRACGCIATTRGDDWKGLRRILVISSLEKGPSKRPDKISSSMYSSTKAMWWKREGGLSKI
jgi:hypothetical protein